MPAAPSSTPRPTATSSCDVLVSAAGFRSSLLPELAGTDTRALTLAADEQLRVLGHKSLWACGDCVSFPHPRWGRIAIPHWDHALWSGRHVADSILRLDRALRARSLLLQRHRRTPHPAGRRRRRRASSGPSDDGLAVGLDAAGAPACVVLLNAPARLREARELLATPLSPHVTIHS